ncbi:hypothetical protein LU293_02235 [Moraxella nasovis]|uniref:MCR_0457 family protein n=1 Tax=Moraxella nasovis TaxID=2904121 RepID=UPI001F606494|nr:hypothetical protein [Moraxella nasovis]UNU73751.1 hypothetical protein LU293_02235 [Moraxella nasovis]
MKRLITVSVDSLCITGFVCVLLLGAIQSSHAGAIKAVGSSNYAELNASLYEIALLQVFSEMCPSMLNPSERVEFAYAYRQQLSIFITHTSNPKDTLNFLSSQPKYRLTLKKMRDWTQSYPWSVNQRMCQDFTKMTF